jgi:hypothetical protein
MRISMIHHAHRGAILVCALRGHAGVMNDIDVSSDTAFCHGLVAPFPFWLQQVLGAGGSSKPHAWQW